MQRSERGVLFLGIQHLLAVNIIDMNYSFFRKNSRIARRKLAIPVTVTKTSATDRKTSYVCNKAIPNPIKRAQRITKVLSMVDIIFLGKDVPRYVGVLLTCVTPDANLYKDFFLTQKKLQRSNNQLLKLQKKESKSP